MTFVVLASPVLADIEYEYDALGRVISVTHPDGKQTIYTYDAAGNRTEKTTYATAQNRTPVAGGDTVNVNEGSVIEWDPRGNDSDPDGNLLEIVTVTPASKGTAEITQAGTHLKYTPQIPYVGDDRFTYTVSDGNGRIATAPVSVIVDNVPPTPGDDTVTVSENGSVTFDPLANDTDISGLPLTITAKSDGVNGGSVAILENGTKLGYTPVATYFGSDSFTYTVSDYWGASATASVAVTVISTNQPPTASDDSVELTSGASANVTPTFSDPDGDPVSIVSVSTPAKGTATIINNGSALSYQANPGTSGTDSFTYTVGDPEGATGSGTISVTINEGNTPPVAVDDNYSLNKNQTYYLSPQSNDTDADGDTLTVTSVTRVFGTYITVTVWNNGTQVKIVVPSFVETSERFSYTISDGNGGEATAEISITALGGGGHL